MSYHRDASGSSAATVACPSDLNPDDAAVVVKVYCSACNCKRRDSEFNFKVNGERKKTCLRHEKKRPAAQAFSDWDEFLESVRLWNTKV
ncbi:MAG: hypothetical protein SEPTF4163_004984 [Sporothrix epigloea]